MRSNQLSYRAFSQLRCKGTTFSFSCKSTGMYDLKKIAPEKPFHCFSVDLQSQKNQGLLRFSG
jgi:hypothetical protein